MKASAKALDLNAVQAFVFTAELQSFTRAAEALGTTQSAISLKLRQLEKHLGRRLLERTPRRVRLSAEGATFMQAARNLLGAHERAIASFGSTRRHLVVGVSHLIVGSELPALLRRMRDHDPNLLIEHTGQANHCRYQRRGIHALSEMPPSARWMVAESHGLRFSSARAQRWSAQQLRPGSPSR